VQLTLTIYTSLYMGVFCMVYNRLLANNYLFFPGGARGEEKENEEWFLYVIRLLDNSASLTLDRGCSTYECVNCSPN
jgi:hypothetical protein